MNTFIHPAAMLHDMHGCYKVRLCIQRTMRKLRLQQVIMPFKHRDSSGMKFKPSAHDKLWIQSTPCSVIAIYTILIWQSIECKLRENVLALYNSFYGRISHNHDNNIWLLMHN